MTSVQRIKSAEGSPSYRNSKDSTTGVKLYASTGQLLRIIAKEKKSQDKKHHCTLSKHDPKAYLKYLTNQSRACRIWTQLIVVSTIDPRTQFYYRSSATLELERKRHILYPALRILHPFSILRNIWEHWMLFVFVSSLILIPIDLLMYEDDGRDFSGLAPMSTFLDFACLIDISVTFFTGVEIRATKEVILNQRYIAKDYVLSPVFYLDLISSIPSDVISVFIHSVSEEAVEVRYIKCFALLKIFRGRYIFRRISTTAEFFNLSENIIRSIKYCLMTALIVHWVGCLTYIIPTYYLLFTGQTVGSAPAGDDSLTIYLDCIYKAISLFLCIRSSQTTIVEEIDLVSGIVISISGRIGVAVLIILFSQIFENVMSPSTKYQGIVNQLENFMKHRQLPMDIQKRLLTYYEYRFQKAYFRESEITSLMSRNILTQINLFCFRNLVDSVSILRILPPDMINEIISKLKCEFFLPNDVIVKNGQTGDCMYFLSTGTVCVLTSSGKEVCHLESGSYFGEIALVASDTKRTADVIAIEICETYRLDKRSFKKLLSQNKTVAQKVENLASIRQEQTKLVEEMHKKLILTKLTQDKMKDMDMEQRRQADMQRPLNVKWNSKLWKNTVPVNQG